MLNSSKKKKSNVRNSDKADDNIKIMYMSMVH